MLLIVMEGLEKCVLSMLARTVKPEGTRPQACQIIRDHTELG